MNVLFLGIDGVLLPLQAQNRFLIDVENMKKNIVANVDSNFAQINAYDIAAVCVDWLPYSVELLRHLLHRFDLKIVVSSDWRISNHRVEMMKCLLRLQNMEGYFHENLPQDADLPKHQQIAMYLAKNPQIEKFIILDHTSAQFSTAFPHHFIHCKTHFGINEYLQAAEAMLGRYVFGTQQLDLDDANNFRMANLSADFFDVKFIVGGNVH